MGRCFSIRIATKTRATEAGGWDAHANNTASYVFSIKYGASDANANNASANDSYASVTTTAKITARTTTTYRGANDETEVKTTQP